MSRGTRTLLVVAIALVAAGLASIGVYRAAQRMPAQRVEAATVPTVVAARAMPMGTRVGANDIRLVAWPAASTVPGSFTNPQAVIDRGLMAPIVENEPLTDAKLAPREAGAGLPPSIPPGMRAISVKVDEVIGVAGFVVPGSFVDVVVTFSQQHEAISRVVVSNVQVLTAGTRSDQARPPESQTGQSTVVTLVVSPGDAEKIALASANGSIMLTLRNPLDREPVDTKGVKLASLLTDPAPPPAPPPPPRVARRSVEPAPAPPPPPAPTKYMVEAFRAGKRTDEVVK